MRIELLMTIISLSLFSASVFGQTAIYEQGFITTKERDTIQCQIAYLDWRINPEVIEAKVEGSIKQFTPDDILAFEIPEKVKYHSRKLRYSTNPYKVNDFIEDDTLRWKEAQVFVESLIEGSTNLYQFIDSTNKIHYVIEKDNVHEVLLLFQYKSEGEIRTVNEFQNQLRRFFNECPRVADKAKYAKYTKKSLEKLTKSFLECMGESTEFEAKKRKAGVHLELRAGGWVANVKIDGEKTDASAKDNPFVGGLSLDIVLPRNHQVWSIINEISYRSYNISIKRGVVVPIVTKRELSYLRLSNGIRRKIVDGPLGIDAFAGISNAIALKDYDDFRRHEQGLFFGARAMYKRFGLELRHELSNGFSAFQSVNSTVRGNYILLNIRLASSKSAKSQYQ